ncbi:MAG: hypothetical protein KC502_13450 [Myxococcales bacterium]|nr:hypothetical protein [Myxococcales bacterium]
MPESRLAGIQRRASGTGHPALALRRVRAVAWQAGLRWTTVHRSPWRPLRSHPRPILSIEDTIADQPLDTGLHGPAWPPLAQANDSHLGEALAAVRAEQRFAGKARRLDALEVAEETESPGIYRVSVGDLSEGNASWESARAFKPMDLDDTARLVAGEHLLTLRDVRWSGEVVAVDEAAAVLWVAVEPGADAPCPGSFLVLPFDFLAGLQLACDDARHPTWQGALSRALGAALAGPDTGDDPDAAAGGPTVADARADIDLQSLFSKPWSVLWGPPGTGKTWTLGRQVARLALRERVLVVSTTNRATDDAALHIGAALREDEGPNRRRSTRLLADGGVRRVGWGADFARFEHEDALVLLDPASVAARRELARVVRARARSRSASERARWGLALGELRANAGNEMRDAMGRFGPRVVVATAFAAVRALSHPELQGWLEVNGGSFDRVVIDEAGLISRAAAATLSLWARCGTVLVGDPRQLAPIAKQSRVLPPARGRWVAESALGFLSTAGANPVPAVHRLHEQHRMHPQIRTVVSDYQYDGALTDAPALVSRLEPERDPPLVGHPRALWLVLDAACPDLAKRRANRGPGGRSWQRPSSLQLFARLLDQLPSAAAESGLFISPFRAQAAAAAQLIDHRPDAARWRASTVHAQQGAEADFVVIDTVRASSTGWPQHEWQRLVNVALSRARLQVLLIATADEMSQPWLRTLLPGLTPLRASFGKSGLSLVAAPEFEAPLRFGLDHHQPEASSYPVGTLGAQLAERRAMRPITSAEQERLCDLRLDGGPRLVRGVAGSGKTWILATWVARTLADPSLEHLQRVWLVYGNHALRPLLLRLIDGAWQAQQPGRKLPSERLALLHIKGLLGQLHAEKGERAEGFDYEAQSRNWLKIQGESPPEARCDALFIDEAQDMGAATLELLFSLVKPWETERPGRRAVHVFYDNDQNVFGRHAPKWSELGLDMRGRSAVMQTSFRSTRPIVEFARNLRYQLQPPRRDEDHTEALRRGMIRRSNRLGRTWWQVHFAEIDGPPPTVRTFATRTAELEFIVKTVRRWLTEQHLSPGDLVVLVNGAEARARVTAALRQGLPGTNVSEQRGMGLSERRGVVRVTTAHSFKGYESEVALVACADTFVAPGTASGMRPLVAPLYVALTRARSLLMVTAAAQPKSTAARRIVSALIGCRDQQNNAPLVTDDLPRARLLTLLARRLGDPELVTWLKDLDERMQLSTEPIWTPDGRLLAAPVIQLRLGRSKWAVFVPPGPSADIRAHLQRGGISVLSPGEQPGAQTRLL